MKTNFQLSPHRTDYKSEFNNHLANDNMLQSSIQGLVRTNRDLQDRLNEEKCQNFDLMELKRRLEEEINRLEFELDRIKSYENLSTREALIKTDHVAK